MNSDFSVFHYGMVIRTTLPYKQTCVLLDYKLGLIEAVFFDTFFMQRMHHGMLLEYVIIPYGKRYRLKEIKLLAVPQEWVTEDINFFHTIIKIISKCMMIGAVNLPIFDAMTLLYRREIGQEERISSQHEIFKKWFLCRLYALLGIYPEDHNVFNAAFFTWISSNENVAVYADDFQVFSALTQWLEKCSNSLLYNE